MTGWPSTRGTRTWFGRSWKSLGVRVSLRTVQRAVEPFRRELRAAVVATTRFETPPGYQL